MCSDIFWLYKPYTFLFNGYWVVQWSWFAWVNALCNLLCRSCERLQHDFWGRFPSRCCLRLCITMEIELRITKQYKCQHCCSCKNYRGKGLEGGKSVFASFWGWPEDCEFMEKMCFGASYSTCNKLLLVARHSLTTGLQKCLNIGNVKFTNSPPSIVKKVRTGSKSSQGS